MQEEIFGERRKKKWSKKVW